MRSSAPRVSVVLLNWNSARDTVACIESLKRSAYPNMQVIVIDNGSTDESVDQLRPLAACGAVVLIEAGKNLGFPAACNLGARRGLADDADYVFLLNNDTEIAPDALEQLVRAAEQDATIAVVTPKIMFSSPPDLVWYGGAKFDWRYLVGRQVGYKQPDRSCYNVETDVPWATGCAMLISRAAIDAVGLLNEDYFFGTEDLDYSLRIVARGFRIRYVPGALLWHKEAAAAGGRDVPQYVYYQVRNVLLFRRLWAGGMLSRVTVAAYSCAWVAKRSLAFGAKGRWRCLIATAYGVADHVRRAYGQREHTLIAYRPPSVKA
jgi:GT2 family glycosyltransferase